MGSRVSRVPAAVRSNSRSSTLKKMVLNVDLNMPAIESYDEGTSFCPSWQAVVQDARRVPPPLVPIDVDLIDDDDDVLICSPRAFSEAKDQSRRNRRRVVHVDAGDYGRPIVQMPQPPPPPKEPTFNCPVCIGPLVEEMSTKCGHIFCKDCIKTAISVQKKCPTCRKKTTMKDIMRVYLPSAS